MLRKCGGLALIVLLILAAIGCSGAASKTPTPTAALRAIVATMPASPILAAPTATTLAATSTLAVPTTQRTAVVTDLVAVNQVVANTDSQGVYIRRTTALADKIKVWPDGTTMVVIGADRGAEGLIWKNVRDPDGNSGWIPAQYLKTASALPAATASTGQLTGQLFAVSEVVDGDTIKVSISGKLESIRIIGIDTPETVDPRTTVQCFGREASAKAKELLTGQQVRLIADPTQGERDKYERLLRYVDRADGLDFGLWMIQNGYAHEYTYDTPYQRQAAYKAAYKDAQAKSLGLWAASTCNGNTTQPASLTQSTQTPTKVATPQVAATPSQTPTRVPAPQITVTPSRTPTRVVTPQVVATPTRVVVQPTAKVCCMVCKTGKACGNSCINVNYTCRQPPGCACD